jgi:hypothetical protein
MRRVVLCAVIVCGAAFLLPTPAEAQVAISGIVKDSSGAVLPGVNVEASSPALIEKTRAVVTDGSGVYRIVDLRPGTYEVTFTLPGFKVLRRADIILEGNFTAQVNADLQVGAVEESVQVTAASPVVDVSGVTTEFVANRSILDSIPTPIRNTPARALLIPGTTVTPFVLGQYNLTSHGSATADFTMAIDGLRVNNLCGSGQFSGFYMNDQAVQEVSFLTGSESAEIQSSGIRVNQVPKDGGNRFSGSFLVQHQGSGLQSDNRSDAVKAATVLIAGTAFDWQINPSFGGPLKKDKVWFYFTYKYQDHKNYVPSAKFPDGSQAFRNDMGSYAASGRVTWAPTSKDKIRAYIEKQYNGEFFNGFNTLATTTPEASTDAFGVGWIPQVRWTRAQSNKLLFEAGLAYYNQPYEQNCSQLATNPLALPRLNGSTGLLTGRCGYTIPEYKSTTKDFNILASASYVTGSHAFKVGMTNLWGENSRTFAPRANINTLVVVNTVIAGPAGPIQLIDFPFQVAVYNTPTTGIQHVNSDLGIYGQDAWTMNRLTVHYGARFEHFDASIPAESSPASTWIAARNFNEIKNVPTWNDWALRLAVNYDLTGDGKTALKANAGKYVASQAAGFAQGFNGMNGATSTVSWNDANGDRTILNADGSIQVNEVAARPSNFGQIVARPDPDLKRGYNWEYSALLSREVLPRTSVTVGFYHRDFYNLQVTDNQNLATTDWTPYSINNPTDTRLPLSGQPMTLYTLNPGKVGTAIDNLVTFSTQNKTTYNGFEVTGNVRRDKLIMFGGVTTDRRASTQCDGEGGGSDPVGSGRDNPNRLRFCDSIPPFRTTFKASAAYSFPHDINLSGSFTAIPGPSVSANYQVTSAVAGRAIIGSTTGAASTTINLVETGSLFLDRQNRLDLRLGKTFRFDARRVQGFMDIFNVFNAGTIVRVNETFAASGTNAWLTPTAIMEGRFIRFGVQMTF